MEEIYVEYSKCVFKYLFSLTNNYEVAEELLQETFYSAIKNINKFRNESSLKNWLYKIAKNKWLDYCKKNKKDRQIDIDSISEKVCISHSFEDDIADRAELIEIYKKIHVLDEKSKEVVYLRAKCEFSFKEIGIIMEQSEEWARITYFRAKNKLREDVKHG